MADDESHGWGKLVPDVANGALAKMLGALNWSYDKAVDGMMGFTDARTMAEQDLKAAGGDPEAAINARVQWQIGKASATGFISNLGGLVILPVAIPANLAGALYFQIQMVACIAYLRGYDLHNDRVRTLAIGCLAGDQVAAPLKLAGVMVGNKLAVQALNKLPGAVLIKINQAIGMRLLTKAGQTGIINFTKLIPIVGGLAGGTFDAVTTKLIANTARHLLPMLDQPLDAEPVDPGVV